MVEVFKTNVERKEDAHRLVGRIHELFSGYRANFDLEDCDRILRVECPRKEIDAPGIVKLLTANGYFAEVLPDIVPDAVAAAFPIAWPVHGSMA